MMQIEEQSPRLYSVEVAAQLLDVSPWTLRRHVSEGRIRAVRVGRLVKISNAEVARLASEGLPSLAGPVEEAG